MTCLWEQHIISMHPNTLISARSRTVKTPTGPSGNTDKSPYSLGCWPNLCCSLFPSDPHHPARPTGVWDRGRHCPCSALSGQRPAPPWDHLGQGQSPPGFIYLFHCPDTSWGWGIPPCFLFRGGETLPERNSCVREDEYYNNITQF